MLNLEYIQNGSTVFKSLLVDVILRKFRYIPVLLPRNNSAVKTTHILL